MYKRQTLQKSVDYIRNADILIIGGTSLVVYPAAGLIDYYRGNKLVLINKAATSRDSQADLVISDPIGEVLGTCLLYTSISVSWMKGVPALPWM